MPLILETTGPETVEAAYEHLIANPGFCDPSAATEHLGPFSHFSIEPEEVEANFPGTRDSIAFLFKSGDRYPEFRLTRETLKFHSASGVRWVGKHLYEYIQRIVEARANEEEPTTISFFKMPQVLISGIIVQGGASQSSYVHALCRLVDGKSDYQDFSLPAFFQLVADHQAVWKRKYAEECADELIHREDGR
jgi:hypothetical protein